MKNLQSLGLVLGIAVVVALLAFSFTSPTVSNFTGLVCRETLAPPRFDPWTGEPHGAVLGPVQTLSFCHPELSDEQPVTTAIPDEMIGRRAVPLPVGFLVGVVLGALVVLVSAFRDERLTANYRATR